ncbi:hypothetical protein B0H34DRAFT_435232 [Crassisporium funariophilum]|nr:hypothetical protein B0H34DRAFT_435232 [Crassisporium funariophilum]
MSTSSHRPFGTTSVCSNISVSFLLGNSGSRPIRNHHNAEVHSSALYFTREDGREEICGFKSGRTAQVGIDRAYGDAGIHRFIYDSGFWRLQQGSRGMCRPVSRSIQRSVNQAHAVKEDISSRQCSDVLRFRFLVVVPALNELEVVLTDDIY